jgi:hypothetical protein
MGLKAKRFACIFLPMLLTIASLILLIMVGLGGTNYQNDYISNIYFLQANTTLAAANSSLTNMASTPDSVLINPSTHTIVMENFYTISLWNYCAGGGGNVTKSILSLGSQTSHAVDFCTGRQMNFYFDPRDVWGFNTTFSNVLFGPDLNNYLDYYQGTSAKYMTTLYILAVTFTGLELILGFTGICSRLGSLFTTLASIITLAFNLAFAGLSTATYFNLEVAFNNALSQDGITFAIGKTMFIYIWVSVFCSIVSVAFWSFSACCCSGRAKRGVDDEKAALLAEPQVIPYDYERVLGPPPRVPSVGVDSRVGQQVPFGQTNGVHELK